MKYLLFICIVWLAGGLPIANAQVVDTVILSSESQLSENDDSDDEAYDSDDDDDHYSDEEEIKSIKKDGLTEPIVRYFPIDSMQALRRQKEYGYMANLDSLLRNYKNELPEEQLELPPPSLFDEGVVRFILWMIAVFAVVYLLYQVFAGRQNLFARNKKLRTATQAETEIVENTLSPIQLALQAAAEGDYRKAVRYQFIYILQLMAERKQIILQPQKTNEQYLNELVGKDQKQEFSKLILQYEYIWYGHFVLNNQQYQTIADGFRNFTSKWL